MSKRKSARKAPSVKPFDASYVSKKKTRKALVTKRAAKAKTPIKKTTLKAVKRSKPEKVVQEEKDYEVEAVWGVQRISKHYSDIDVLLKWVGYKEPTWETLENAKSSSELLKPWKGAIDRLAGKLKLNNEDEPIGESDDDDDSGSDPKNKEYEVEDIIGVRYSKEEGRIEYLVKWKSYPYSQSTWEPFENVEDLPEYLDFFKEAVEVLEYENRVGIEPKRTSKKRKLEAGDGPADDDDEEVNGDDQGEGDEDGSGDTKPLVVRGRGRQSGGKGKGSKAKVANGSAARSSSRRRK